MHGYTVEELIGQHVRLLAPKELREEVPLEKAKTLSAWKRESVNIRKNSSTFPVQFISTVVENTELGQRCTGAACRWRVNLGKEVVLRCRYPGKKRIQGNPHNFQKRGNDDVH